MKESSLLYKDRSIRSPQDGYALLKQFLGEVDLILANCASCIVGHNHPSNDTTPSLEDIDITKSLIEAGDILGIKVLDQVILGSDRFLSLKDKGYI